MGGGVHAAGPRLAPLMPPPPPPPCIPPQAGRSWGRRTLPTFLQEQWYESAKSIGMMGMTGEMVDAACEGPLTSPAKVTAMPRGSLRNPIFFAKDRLYEPPPGTTNRQPPTPTAANRHQPPTANHQPPPTTNRQPPTPTNHQSPTTNRHQSPPIANRQPPTANRHQPWLNVSATCGLFAKLQFWNTFFHP